MKFNKKLVSNGLLVIFLVALVYYVFKNLDDFKSLAQLDLKYIVIAFFLRTLQLMISGIFIMDLVNLFLKKDKLGFMESFYISVFSALGNFFGFLQGGVGMRAIYLKDKYNLDYSSFTLTVVIHYTITFLIYGFAGIVAIVLLNQVQPELIIPMTLITFGSFIALFSLNIPILKEIYELRIFKFLSKFLNQLVKLPYLFKSNFKLFLRLKFLYLLRFLIACIIQYLFFISLGFKVSIFTLMFYTSITGLSIIVNLTPASIGFREGIFLLIQDYLGLSTNEILQLAILDRTILVLVLVSTFFIMKFFKKKILPDVQV